MPEVKLYLKDLCRTNPSQKTRRNYLRLDMNENVSGLPEDFIKKVFSGITPHVLATYPEYGMLQGKLAKHNNLNPENICLSNGSDGAIKYIFDAYVSLGDKVLLTEPTFAMYSVYCKMFNAAPITISYKPDLSFPEDDFMDRISADVKIAVVVNPNNPTGTIIEQDRLIRMIKKAFDNDVLMIVDEAYFYYYPKTLIGEVENYKNLIVLRTFSKLCGMATARLGYAAANSEIIENLRKVKPTYDVNGLAVLLAEGLLDNSSIIKDLVKRTNEGKKYLIQKLSEENIEYVEGYANFILIKCYERVDAIIRRLAEKNILVSGEFKQDFLRDFIRVTVGNKMCMEQFWKSFINIWKTEDLN